MPIVASEHGGQIDFVIALIHVVMLVALVGWTVFFVVPLIRFRARRSPNANYAGLKTKLPFVAVGALAVAEMLVLIGWSLPLWEAQVSALPEIDDETFEVRVVAQQFQWNIHYPGPDGVFGRTAIAHMDPQLNPIGLDPEDLAGEDDITTLNQLHVPVNAQVVVYLSSKDVIHSFFLPEFRVKHDAIPGMRIPVHFRPTLTTRAFREATGEPERNFEIACAQLCGLNHYTMRGFVTVESREEFRTWFDAKLKEKQEAAEDDFWFEQ